MEQTKRRVIEKEQELKETVEKKPFDPKTYSFEDMLNYPTPAERKWRVDKLLPQTGLIILAGKTRSLKSWTALDLALSLIHNEKFLDTYTITPCNVLYINEEILTEEMAEKVKKLKIRFKTKTHNLTFTHQEGVRIDTPQGREWLDKKITELDSKVVIVDVWSRVHRKQEDSAAEINMLYQDFIAPLIKKHECLFVFLMHLRKTPKAKDRSDMLDEIRGSSDIVNLADCVIILDRASQETKFLFKQLKLRKAHEQPFTSFQLTDSEDEQALWFECLGEYHPKEAEAEKYLKDLIEWAFKEGITTFTPKDAKEAMEKMGHEKRIWERAKKVGDEKGFWKIDGRKYTFTQTPQNLLVGFVGKDVAQRQTVLESEEEDDSFPHTPKNTENSAQFHTITQTPVGGCVNCVGNEKGVGNQKSPPAKSVLKARQILEEKFNSVEFTTEQAEAVFVGAENYLEELKHAGEILEVKKDLWRVHCE